MALHILTWAIGFNKNLLSNRSNTCYDTARSAHERLAEHGVKSTVMYAEQTNGFSHWFLIINSGPHKGKILDFTACQFNQFVFPQICFGTLEELTERFGEQQFWKALGTEKQTQQVTWRKRHGFLD